MHQVGFLANIGIISSGDSIVFLKNLWYLFANIAPSKKFSFMYKNSFFFQVKTSLHRPQILFSTLFYHLAVLPVKNCKQKSPVTSLWVLGLLISIGRDVINCGFCLSRILLYFPLSVCSSIRPWTGVPYPSIIQFLWRRMTDTYSSSSRTGLY